MRRSKESLSATRARASRMAGSHKSLRLHPLGHWHCNLGRVSGTGRVCSMRQRQPLAAFCFAPPTSASLRLAPAAAAPRAPPAFGATAPASPMRPDPDTPVAPVPGAYWRPAHVDHDASTVAALSDGQVRSGPTCADGTGLGPLSNRELACWGLRPARHL
jgi:hypothetical protein